MTIAAILPYKACINGAASWLAPWASMQAHHKARERFWQSRPRQILCLLQFFSAASKQP